MFQLRRRRVSLKQYSSNVGMGYAHSDVVTVHIVALQPNRIATRPARVEHRRVVRADDEVVVVGEGQVLLERGLLVHIVPAWTQMNQVSRGRERFKGGHEGGTYTRP